jgi:hypothetical protein
MVSTDTHSKQIINLNYFNRWWETFCVQTLNPEKKKYAKHILNDNYICYLCIINDNTLWSIGRKLEK